jgi:hypothetical protein
MAERWLCTACGEPGGEPASKLLGGGVYGSQRCISESCKGKKRVFQKEVNHDDRQLHVQGSERPPQR